MSGRLLLGKPLADEIAANVKAIADGCPTRPKLTTIGFDEPRWQQYANSLQKSAEKYGFCVENVMFEQQSISPQMFFEAIERANNDDDVKGILLQQPLPSQFACAVKHLSADKDADCLSPDSVFDLYNGGDGFRPATALAALRLLEYYGYDLCGKNVTVVGRGTVGRPLALMAVKKNATVTVCHTKTRNLSEACRSADIIVSACGVKGLINKDCVTDGSVVVDVGLSFDNGKTCGDVDAEVYDVCQAVSPVPGGVGPVTRAVLFESLAKKLK